MKKHLLSGIAVTSALTLALGSVSPVFAARSSVSGNSVSGNSVSGTSVMQRELTDEEREEIRVNNIIQEFINKASSYLLGRPGSKLSAAQAGYVTVSTGNEKLTISPDYSKVTDSDSLVSVSAPKKDQACQALSDYVKNDASQAVKMLGPVKFQMFKAGTPVWDGFGSFTATFSIGKAYDGRTASIYQIHKDGSVTKTSAVIDQGRVKITLKDMGAVMIAIQ